APPNPMKSPCASRRHVVRAVPALLLALTSPALLAQAAPVPVASSPAATSTEKTVEMSPFEVQPDEVGYEASNTTSGSRLNTSLKDTAASISPFTKEFLSDIAATNVTEMLAYAT